MQLSAPPPHDIKSLRLFFWGSALELDKTTETLGLNPEVKLGKGQEPVQTVDLRMVGDGGGGKEALCFSLPSDHILSTFLHEGIYGVPAGRDIRAPPS